MTLPWHVLSLGGPYLSALSVLFMSASLASPPHQSRTVEKEMCSAARCPVQSLRGHPSITASPVT